MVWIPTGADWDEFTQSLRDRAEVVAADVAAAWIETFDPTAAAVTEVATAFGGRDHRRREVSFPPPQVGPQISVIVRDDQLATIDQIATNRRQPRSTTIRDLIDLGIAHTPQEDTTMQPALEIVINRRRPDGTWVWHDEVGVDPDTTHADLDDWLADYLEYVTEDSDWQAELVIVDNDGDIVRVIHTVYRTIGDGASRQ
jgi:hypothetical protein